MDKKRTWMRAALAGGALVLCAAGCTTPQSPDVEEEAAPEPVATAQAAVAKAAHPRPWHPRMRQPRRTRTAPSPR